MRTAIAAIIGTLLLAGTTASADWPAGGKFVGSPYASFHGSYGVRFLDLPSGDLALAMFGVGGNGLGYSMQRISPSGEFAPGWPAQGIVFGQFTGAIPPFQHGFAVDDSGCVWHGGDMSQSSGKISKLLRPDAALVPGTSAAWQTFTSVSTGPADAAPAPGGAYIVESSRIQRMTRAGTPAAGWPANGISTGISAFDVSVVGDGADGAVVLGLPLGETPHAQRIDANAIRHPGWPAAGVLLSNDPEDVDADFGLELGAPLIPSGPGAFIAAWGTPYQSGTDGIKKVKLQRFLLDGTLDPAWPPGGLLAVPADSISGVTLIPDGLGGGHLLWYNLHLHTIFGKHVLASGQFAGAVGPYGIALPAPGSQPHITTRGYLGHPLGNVPADAAPNGGLVFAWNDDALAPTESIRVRWLLSDYTTDPSEPAAGRLIVPTGPGTRLRGVHSDGVGGAYVAWEQYDPNQQDPFADTDIWMTRLLPSSLLGVHPAPPVATLALSAPRPNPARAAVSFDVTLPDDSPARVELLDVAGRVQRSQVVSGPGSHNVTIGDAGSLAPGLYFARVTNRSGTRSMRVVLAR